MVRGRGASPRRPGCLEPGRPRPGGSWLSWEVRIGDFFRFSPARKPTRADERVMLSAGAQRRSQSPFSWAL